jgi:hypothetical protein
VTEITDILKSNPERPYVLIWPAAMTSGKIRQYVYPTLTHRKMT